MTAAFFLNGHKTVTQWIYSIQGRFVEAWQVLKWFCAITYDPAIQKKKKFASKSSMHRSGSAGHVNIFLLLNFHRNTTRCDDLGMFTTWYRLSGIAKLQ